MKISRVLSAGHQHANTRKPLQRANDRLREARQAYAQIEAVCAHPQSRTVREALAEALRAAQAEIDDAVTSRAAVYRARCALRAVARINGAPGWRELPEATQERIARQYEARVNWRRVLAQ